MSLYLYGIMRVADPEGWRPPPGVEALPCGGLTALVRELGGGRPVLEPEAALAHARVLEEAMAGGTVLPCSFGTVAADAAAVRALVAAHRETLEAAAARLEGKEEAGLKGFWNPGAVRREVEAELGSLDRWREGGREAAIAVGQRVEAVLARWREELVPAVVAALRPACVELAENPPFGHRMLFNLALLVERARERELRARVHALDRRWGDRVELKYVAGLPPFNFVHLRLQAAG